MNPSIAMPAAGASSQLPHDIRPLLAYRPTWTDYAPWLCLAFLVALLFFIAFYWWKTRRPKQKPPVPVDPWQVLLENLEALTVAVPFMGPPVVEYYFQLSLLLREAIERRTAIPATDLTLSELRSPLRKKLPLATEQVEAVLSFLERSDMVKFAGFAASLDEAAAAKKQVCAWARELKPLPVVTAHLEQRKAQT